MKASDWEFKNRAMLFGLIFAVSFPLYAVDKQNVTAALGSWLAPRWGMTEDRAAQMLLVVAALLLAIAALVRTWASAYLHASVVYAEKVKTAALVADGPYRQVRNPLYLGNVFMILGMGAMMSRVGFALALVLMMVFCYRLIFREEADLLASQGESYRAYLKAVPRLFPSPWPRIASAGSQAKWRDGFVAELWCWGFALAVGAFAATLSSKVFFSLVAASLVFFWMSSSLLGKKPSTQA